MRLGSARKQEKNCRTCRNPPPLWAPTTPPLPPPGAAESASPIGDFFLKTALRIAVASAMMLGPVAMYSQKADSQAMAGRELGTKKVSVDYYKAPPGRRVGGWGAIKKTPGPLWVFISQKAVG